eukprot:363074-Chlamydomonas_euryale.AAC.9
MTSPHEESNNAATPRKMRNKLLRCLHAPRPPSPRHRSLARCHVHGLTREGVALADGHVANTQQAKHTPLALCLDRQRSVVCRCGRGCYAASAWLYLLCRKVGAAAVRRHRFIAPLAVRQTDVAQNKSGRSVAPS